MKVTGSSVLNAPPEQVWQAITDPAVLAAVIPGCDGLTPLAPDRFRLGVTLGVAAIKGSYTGEVSFAEMVAPRSLTLRATGSGAPGTIDTTVAVVLTGLDEQRTRVDYDADAVVGGMVGGVGQRVLGAVAKRTADAFFTAIDGTFGAPVPVAVAGPAVRPATGPVPGPATGGTGAPAAAPRWDLLGAVAVGAVSALAGVLVGVLVGRRRS